MQLATWNVNSLSVRLPQVLDWLAANPVDVLVLQELKMTDDKFPADAFLQAGYHAQWFGQKTYNGVALLSKSPATDVVKNIPGFDDDMARVITGTVDGIRVVGAYFPNGQEPGSEKFEYKMEWLTGMRRWLKDELTRHPKLVVMGDYNITFDDADVWDPVGLEGSIHCTEEERYHLRALVSLGLHDSYRMFAHPPKSFSWWDYRDFGFRRNRGLRIDHILVSDTLKPAVARCEIDVAPRKNERPSDHAPVVVEIGG
jgi:exodeoxyribonuclease-3